MFCQSAIGVTDASQIGEARREANRAARWAGLDQTDCGKASIVASELATNLLRYASEGELLIRGYEIAGVTGVELISIDRGPGMADVDQCLQDGYSSGGTPGNGLGAIRRLASEFDIFSSSPDSSSPGGTVVLARIEKYDSALSKPEFQWGVINRPAPREQLCGDTWRIWQHGGEASVMIADGLGHGPQAAEAADLAGDLFDSAPISNTSEFLVSADRRLRGTRGAAVAMAHINARSSALQYTGVGNIAGNVRNRDALTGRGLISHNGTVGAVLRKVQTFDYECPTGALLTMHSDGLKNRWALAPYPGLMTRHPAVIAGVLYRDFRRDNDDVTVCVLRTISTAA